jgi:ABC-type transporter Mla subunit MlaD
MSDHDAPARTPEQIEAEIAEQREQLADTVDQLAAKLDVKSRAQQKVASLKDSATTETGTPRTEVVAAAGSLLAMAVVLLLWRRRRTH